MRAVLVLAAFANLAAIPAAHALSAATTSAALGAACAGRAHADPGGACPAEPLQIDRYCPAGTLYQPAREGFSCEPFSLKD